MSSSEKDNPQSSPFDRPALYIFLWVVIIVFISWIAIGSQADNGIIRLPYSTFLAQVQAGNIALVTIAGDQISGSFSKPYSPAEAANAKTYAHFITMFPADIGDPQLMPLLRAKKITIDVKQTGAGWLPALFQGLPFIILIIIMIWLVRSFSQKQAGTSSFGKTKARRYSSEQPEVTFEDVAGADEAKTDLQEIVDFLRQPAKYHGIGAHIPRGVLLVGPPGTGKTLLARAIAGEAGVPFFSLSGSEFVEMFVGVGASRVRDLFAQAKNEAPAIVFIDELDAVGRRRGAGMGTVNDEREQTLNQLLVEMDGFDTMQETIILAATNRPDVLDPALLRPGRFDRHVTVELPDQNGREAILRIHTRKLNLASDVDLKVLARGTIGFSGADLANLANEAALVAARHDNIVIRMADFEEAQDKVLLGGARSLILSDQQKQIIAYHEAGHALVAWLTPPADPVYKVTIIPRGRALGLTEQRPNEDQYNYSRTYLLARLAVMLGGRTAEELVIGDITTGAESDLVEATRLARRMITRWGMSDLGLAAFQADAEHPFLGYSLTQGPEYSEATAAQIDQAVQSLLEERHEVVHRLLADASDKLDRLAQALLQKETIGHEELMNILGPRPLLPVVDRPAGWLSLELAG
ncbi:MAG: ATP-dependent metallopeptidase FtsH/Yme1/Tma family protein [Anaerolineaceae bacterium]|nr:ATP-dependent metallopeptidase FtsH/Yme1/Tma family protein [Anaerolineaceae bacterium]MCB9101588.1 ATP-dependent metallopeptidase FtsH/Yme1/Tma family protein [Anaerolineales bacterium]